MTLLILTCYEQGHGGLVPVLPLRLHDGPYYPSRCLASSSAVQAGSLTLWEVDVPEGRVASIRGSGSYCVLCEGGKEGERISANEYTALMGYLQSHGVPAADLARAVGPGLASWSDKLNRLSDWIRSQGGSP